MSSSSSSSSVLSPKTPPPPSPPTTTTPSVVNPLCIILVKNGSKGDRLLFRFPYKTLLRQPSSTSAATEAAKPSGPSVHNSSSPNSSSSTSTSSSASTTTPTSHAPLSHQQQHQQSRRRKVSRDVREDVEVEPPALTTSGSREGRSGSCSYRPLRKNSNVSQAGVLFRGKSPSGGVSSGNHHHLSNSSDVFTDEKVAPESPADGSKMLGELSDKDLSNLLAVGTELSERKFELKLNYLRFVGHPTLMQDPKCYRNIMNTSFQTSVKLFHIVFCLNAVATHSIVKCFHDLSKRLGIALRHEEYRCGYLTQEFKGLVAMHDELCTEQEDEMARAQQKIFDSILRKSNLAQLMKQVYEEVVDHGRTFIRVNDWVQISFCLPQRIHSLSFRDYSSDPSSTSSSSLVEPETIHACLEAIRPYHSILLLVESDELLSTLWYDASSTISRLLQVYSPLKSLQTLAADADLSLSQVVEIASHLVYWAQATVIYPLCETNTYVLAPDIAITSEHLRREFRGKFSGLSLAQTLADFSLPMPLGERINPIIGGNFVQSQQIQLVTWMLKNHLLVHLHTYVYLTTYLDGGGGEALESSFPFNIPFDLKIRSAAGAGDGAIRAFEDEDEDATASDSFSEATTDDQVDGGGGVRNARLQEEDSTQSSTAEPLPPLPVDPSAEKEPFYAELNVAVRRAVSIVLTRSTSSPSSSALTTQDIRMFSRLSKYFTGDFHIEEIMYRENVRRSQLMLLLDKFRDVLITVEKEDAEINFFK